MPSPSPDPLAGISIGYAVPEPKTLKVLQFNTFLLDFSVVFSGYAMGTGRVTDIPFKKKFIFDVEQRRKIMPSFLASTGADVLVLEEVWSEESKDRLIQDMYGFGYTHYRYNSQGDIKGWGEDIGDGLLILSKYPLRVADQDEDHPLGVYRFKDGTQIVEKVFDEKAAMKLQVYFPNRKIGWIDLWAAHPGAVEFKDGHYDRGESIGHKAQMKEISTWMRQHQSSKYTILAADLNLHYQEWQDGHFEIGSVPAQKMTIGGVSRSMNVLTNQTWVPGKFSLNFSQDYLTLLNGSCPGNKSLINTYLSANNKSAADEPDYTFDKNNPYVSDGFFPGLPSEVEDYIFVCENPTLKAVRSERVFNQAISEELIHQMESRFPVKPLTFDFPIQGFYDKWRPTQDLTPFRGSPPRRLSDHYGIVTTFQVQ